MKIAKSNFRHSVLVRLIIPALIILLPVLAVGGAATGNSTAQAAAQLPGSATQADNDALADKYEVLVMRVYFRDMAERNALAYELAPEEVPTKGGYLTVMRDRDLYYNLKARGYRVEVDEGKSRFLSDPQSIPDTFYGGYKTVEEMHTFLDQKASQYPTLAQKVDYGDSWCKTHPGSCNLPAPWNGYDLYAMRITNQAITGPKPVLWADGGIHAREIATPEVIMRMISWLLDNYNTNADARWLVDYHEIWLVPTVNPDGHHIVESGGGGNNPYLYRKNGNNSAGSCSWPPNAGNHFGVDNNRNFPFKWGCCGGSSGAPCDQTYRGTAAGGEEETAAMVAKIRTLIPDQRGPGDNDAAPITTTGVYQNIHTVVPVNLYPWGWSSNLMPNYNETDNIARRISSPGQGGNNYPYGCIQCELYPVDGGSIDWSYGELGVASISTELSGGDFLPPYSCIDNPGCDTSQGIWPENRGMLTYLAKIARTPYLLSHGPDANAVATNPMTATVGSSVQVTTTIKFNWTASDGQPNRFSQNVGAAEYYLDTPPWAGGTAVAMTPSDGTFNSPQEGAQATIDTTSLPLGRHIVFVRGRGQNDFSGHQTWGPISAAFLDVVPGGGPTSTPVSTSTPVPSTSTNTPVSTSTSTSIAATATSTPVTATANPTTCALQFTDVPEGSTFYENIRCLACRGIINGYTSGCETGDPCFKPGNFVTRGQMAKIVSNSAGFNEPAGSQQFEDVPIGSTFYDFIWRLADRGIVTGYPCGGLGEPCVPPDDRLYFRPNANITRGQISKVVSEAASFTDPVGAQQFEDVLPGSTFYDWIWRLTSRGIMSGYPCGGPGEPCNPPDNRPYFRPGNNATRGQASKIVANTFYPECDTPAR
ncbi:MAG: M14 family zinc carboxypeptidase [Chloroflexia bacterium]